MMELTIWERELADREEERRNRKKESYGNINRRKKGSYGDSSYRFKNSKYSWRGKGGID